MKSMLTALGLALVLLAGAWLGPAGAAETPAERKAEKAGQKAAQGAKATGQKAAQGAKKAGEKTTAAVEKGTEKVMKGRTVGGVLTDASITAQVKTALMQDKQVAAHTINVDTLKGIVHLKGKVQTAAERKRAVALASKVKGVKGVKSHLMVAKAGMNAKAGAAAKTKAAKKVAPGG